MVRESYAFPTSVLEMQSYSKDAKNRNINSNGFFVALTIMPAEGLTRPIASGLGGENSFC